MKTLILTLFLFTSTIYAQNNYLPYYQMVNEAKKLTSEGKIKDAKTLYKKGLTNYIGFDLDYVYAINSCLKLNDYKLAYWFLREKTLKTTSFSDEQFNDSLFKPFLNSTHGKKYTANKSKWDKENRKTIDPYTNYFWAQLDATDQLVRDGTLRVMKPIIQNDSIYTAARSAVFNEVDQNNFVRFRNYVMEYGFPGRFKLGGEDNYNAFIIHHYRYQIHDSLYNENEKGKFNFMDSLMKAEVINGQFQPWYLAYCYDYSISNDSLSYYAIARFFRDENGSHYINFPVLQPETLNKRRVEIGLNTIEEQCQINKHPLPPNYKTSKKE